MSLSSYTSSNSTFVFTTTFSVFDSYIPFPNLSFTFLLACVCVRGEENLPKDVQKSFYGFSLPREKLFVYPWELKEQKETHPDQKIENIFY